jgi:fructose-1,6-bisphosphatase/inositol monophosphatase family enzyme
MSAFQDFAAGILVPASRAVLLRAFEAYRNGADLDVATKQDGSPASEADREAERVLRRLIAAHYPDHGIVGEEFGAERADADYVWVLDPLDGTREFLAKADGWGTLIALLEKGKPVVGIIDDPLQGRIRLAGPAANKSTTLKNAQICCTNPALMFAGTQWQTGAERLFAMAGKVETRRNCLGFADVAEGKADLAVEAGLKLHDVAALLPVLWEAGAICLMLDGRDYRAHAFDLSLKDESYTLLTGRDAVLVQEALGYFGSVERQAQHG